MLWVYSYLTYNIREGALLQLLLCALILTYFLQLEACMARGSKDTYTAKQKRQAYLIEKSEKARGASEKTAARIAWATVNKQTGGGKKKKKPAKSLKKTKK